MSAPQPQRKTAQPSAFVAQQRTAAGPNTPLIGRGGGAAGAASSISTQGLIGGGRLRSHSSQQGNTTGTGAAVFGRGRGGGSAAGAGMMAGGGAVVRGAATGSGGGRGGSSAVPVPPHHFSPLPSPARAAPSPSKQLPPKRRPSLIQPANAHPNPAAPTQQALLSQGPRPSQAASVVSNGSGLLSARATNPNSQRHLALGITASSTRSPPTPLGTPRIGATHHSSSSPANPMTVAATPSSPGRRSGAPSAGAGASPPLSPLGASVPRRPPVTQDELRALTTPNWGLLWHRPHSAASNTDSSVGSGDGAATSSASPSAHDHGRFVYRKRWASLELSTTAPDEDALLGGQPLAGGVVLRLRDDKDSGEGDGSSGGAGGPKTMKRLFNSAQSLLQRATSSGKLSNSNSSTTALPAGTAAAGQRIPDSVLPLDLYLIQSVPRAIAVPHMAELVATADGLLVGQPRDRGAKQGSDTTQTADGGRSSSRSGHSNSHGMAAIFRKKLADLSPTYGVDVYNSSDDDSASVTSSPSRPTSPRHAPQHSPTNTTTPPPESTAGTNTTSDKDKDRRDSRAVRQTPRTEAIPPAGAALRAQDPFWYHGEYFLRLVPRKATSTRNGPTDNNSIFSNATDGSGSGSNSATTTAAKSANVALSFFLGSFAVAVAPWLRRLTTTQSTDNGSDRDGGSVLDSPAMSSADSPASSFALQGAALEAAMRETLYYDPSHVIDLHMRSGKERDRWLTLLLSLKSYEQSEEETYPFGRGHLREARTAIAAAAAAAADAAANSTASPGTEKDRLASGSGAATADGRAPPGAMLVGPAAQALGSLLVSPYDRRPSLISPDGGSTVPAGPELVLRLGDAMNQSTFLDRLRKAPVATAFIAAEKALVSERCPPRPGPHPTSFRCCVVVLPLPVMQAPDHGGYERLWIRRYQYDTPHEDHDGRSGGGPFTAAGIASRSASGSNDEVFLCQEDRESIIDIGTQRRLAALGSLRRGRRSLPSTSSALLHKTVETDDDDNDSPRGNKASDDDEDDEEEEGGLWISITARVRTPEAQRQHQLAQRLVSRRYYGSAAWDDLSDLAHPHQKKQSLPSSFGFPAMDAAVGGGTDDGATRLSDTLRSLPDGEYPPALLASRTHRIPSSTTSLPHFSHRRSTGRLASPSHLEVDDDDDNEIEKALALLDPTASGSSPSQRRRSTSAAMKEAAPDALLSAALGADHQIPPPRPLTMRLMLDAAENSDFEEFATSTGGGGGGNGSLSSSPKSPKSPRSPRSAHHPHHRLSAGPWSGDEWRQCALFPLHAIECLVPYEQTVAVLPDKHPQTGERIGRVQVGVSAEAITTTTTAQHAAATAAAGPATTSSGGSGASVALHAPASRRRTSSPPLSQCSDTTTASASSFTGLSATSGPALVGTARTTGGSSSTITTTTTIYGWHAPTVAAAAEAPRAACRLSSAALGALLDAAAVEHHHQRALQEQVSAAIALGGKQLSCSASSSARAYSGSGNGSGLRSRRGTGGHGRSAAAAATSTPLATASFRELIQRGLAQRALLLRPASPTPANVSVGAEHHPHHSPQHQQEGGGGQQQVRFSFEPCAIHTVRSVPTHYTQKPTSPKNRTTTAGRNPQRTAPAPPPNAVFYYLDVWYWAAPAPHQHASFTSTDGGALPLPSFSAHSGRQTPLHGGPSHTIPVLSDPLGASSAAALTGLQSVPLLEPRKVTLVFSTNAARAAFCHAVGGRWQRQLAAAVDAAANTITATPTSSSLSASSSCAHPLRQRYHCDPTTLLATLQRAAPDAEAAVTAAASHHAATIHVSSGGCGGGEEVGRTWSNLSWSSARAALTNTRSGGGGGASHSGRQAPLTDAASYAHRLALLWSNTARWGSGPERTTFAFADLLGRCLPLPLRLALEACCSTAARGSSHRLHHHHSSSHSSHRHNQNSFAGVGSASTTGTTHTPWSGRRHHGPLSASPRGSLSNSLQMMSISVTSPIGAMVPEAAALDGGGGLDMSFGGGFSASGGGGGSGQASRTQSPVRLERREDPSQSGGIGGNDAFLVSVGMVDLLSVARDLRWHHGLVSGRSTGDRTASPQSPASPPSPPRVPVAAETAAASSPCVPSLLSWSCAANVAMLREHVTIAGNACVAALHMGLVPPADNTVF